VARKTKVKPRLGPAPVDEAIGRDGRPIRPGDFVRVPRRPCEGRLGREFPHWDIPRIRGWVEEITPRPDGRLALLLRTKEGWFSAPAELARRAYPTRKQRQDKV